MNELRPYLLSLEDMYDLIQEKKLNGKKTDLNIFTLSGFELKYFFKLLSQDINNVPHRFQLAVRVGAHWFGVDCQIENQKLHLFILDAGNQPHRSASWLLNEELKAIITSSFINLTIFVYKGVPIQWDNQNCSFFTLDHLFRLSSKDEHWNDLKNLPIKSGNSNIIYFNEKECPNSLGFIFKNIQSQRSFNSLCEGLKKSIINKKGLTLEEVVSKNTAYDEEMLENKNQGIKVKREKYMKRYDFFKLIKDKNIILSRQGFEMIGGELGKWIAEAIQSLEATAYLESLVLKNELLVTSNSRLILDVILNCSLNNLFFILLKNNNINNEFIPSDLYFLISKNNFTLFCPIFDRLKNLSSLDFQELDRRTSWAGKEKFKTYISSSLDSIEDLTSVAACFFLR